VLGHVNSELDEVLVSYLEESKSSGRQICYFGYADYFANQALLSAVPIQSTEGDIVTPTYETIGDGGYNPLARRINMTSLDDAEALDDTIPFIKEGEGENDDGGISTIAVVGIAIGGAVASGTTMATLSLHENVSFRRSG
jgi:hypothetical protein